MGVARYLTLVWPGLPWLWLRGSLAGLVVALAFAVAVDVAVVTTWIWPELVDLPVAIGVWGAAAAIWILATVSAVSAFPPPLVTGREREADGLFVAARDAYLARDWTTAEARLRALLVAAPTDGEGQLLLATLLRRVGRLDEARAALGKLSASDCGAAWRPEIARERARIAGGDRGPAAAGEPGSDAVTLQIHADSPAAGRRGQAA